MHRSEHKKRTAEYYKNNKAKLTTYNKQYRSTVAGHLHLIYSGMKRRCNSPIERNYKNYGGRGIKLQFTVNEFVDYVVNVLQVDPRGLTIDRIDNDGHYEPGNIRFITRAKNNGNKRRRVKT